MTSGQYSFCLLLNADWLIQISEGLAVCKVVPNKIFLSKWFEPRSISSSCSVIVRVSVVLKRTVGDSD